MTPARPNRIWSLGLLGLTLSLVALLTLGGVAASELTRVRVERRGIETGLDSQAPFLTPPRFGVNVALQKYSDPADLDRALANIKALGVGTIRQRLAWADVEPLAGQFEWQSWDQALERAHDAGLEILLILDTSPVWARPVWEADNRWAPPAAVSDYARFAQAVAERYGHLVTAYQIWDSPNIWPHWGKGPIDPAGYVALLREASQAIRNADPDALIVAGGLQPNTEAGGRNMGDLLFLREIYRRGAGESFDVLGAKPYGFWTGPEDRRVDAEVLNMSRVILLREEMHRRGDEHKPIWALEMGWCALPDGWVGEVSPLGSDLPAVQLARTSRALDRIQREWPWMGLAFVGHLSPDAAPSSYLWGYALQTPAGAPTPLGELLPTLSPDPAPTARAPLVGLTLVLSLSALGMAALLTLAVRAGRRVPWRSAWAWLARRFDALPGGLRGALSAGSFWALACAPWPLVRLAGLGLYALSAGLQPKLAMATAVACIALAPIHTRLGPGSFSLAEVSLLCAVGAQVWRALMDESASRAGKLSDTLHGLRLLDWAMLALLILGAVTSLRAEYARVAWREWRTVLLAACLLYGMVRLWAKDGETLHQIAAVLWWSALAVACYALLVYPLAEGVIEAEGVRRARAFYGSPNNLALYLERLFPLGLALAWGSEGKGRRLYALGSLVVLAAALLTFSRGAWLLGLPIGVLCLAVLLMRQRSAKAVVVGGLALALLFVLASSLLPKSALPERLAALLDLGQGTTGLRLKLWRSSLEMASDHPWLGVGLDNFMYYYGDYIQPGAEADRWLSHPHNLLLDFWLRLGLGGVLILVALVTGAVGSFLHLARRRACTESQPDATPLSRLYIVSAGMIAGLGAAAVHGMVDASFFVVELALWCALALAWLRQSAYLA